MAVAVKTTLTPRPAALVSAALLALSAAWYALILLHLTVPPPPPDTGGSPDALHAWYGWQSLVQRQQWVVSGLAALGLVALAATVAGRLVQRRAGWQRVAVIAVGSGSAAWAVGTLLQIGERRAVGLMAAHRNPIDTVNAIAFTVDTTTAVFECAALLALGAGLLALAAGGVNRVASAAAGLILAVLGVAYGVDDGDLTNLLTVVVGLLVLPGWLLLTDLRPPTDVIDDHS